LTGNVVELVEVLVLLLVVDDVEVVIGPTLVEVVELSGALDDVLLLVEVEVLEVIDGPVVLVVDDVVEDVLDVVLDVLLEDGRDVVVEDVLDVVVTDAALVLVVGDVLEVVLDDGCDVVVEDVLDVGRDVVEDVLDVVVTGAALVLVVDGAAVVEVDDVVATVLVVVPFVVDVVVPEPLGPQRNAKCRPALIVLAQAPPVSSVVEPIDSLARGLRIMASTRLWPGSFTRVPPTSTVGSGAPVSGGRAKIVASPSTRSCAIAIDVGAPGESDTNTSRPVRTLQNV
jgi:hypothetical protein